MAILSAKDSNALGLLEKKTYAYRERDAGKRSAFIAQLAGLDKGQLVYLDKAGIDDTDDYGYGYCLKGERFEAERQGSHKERVSFIAAWHQRRLVAPMT